MCASIKKLREEFHVPLWRKFREFSATDYGSFLFLSWLREFLFCASHLPYLTLRWTSERLLVFYESVRNKKHILEPIYSLVHMIPSFLLQPKNNPRLGSCVHDAWESRHLKTKVEFISSSENRQLSFWGASSGRRDRSILWLSGS